MGRSRKSAVAVVLALVGAATFTTGATVSPAVFAESAASTPPVVVSISAKRVVSMPTTIQPGVTRFEVTSSAKEGSSFQLVRPAPGYTPAEASRDIEKGLENGNVKAIKRFEANVTLLGGMTADDTADVLVVDLDLGSYWALDTETNDPAKFFAFTVDGADTGNTVPEATTIKARLDTTWAAKPAAIPHKGLLRFKNNATNNHFIEMAKLKKGYTYKDFKEWLAAIQEGPGGPPPVNFELGLGSGALSPGYAATFNYNLPKGDYVMVCFWPDASMGGMPHAFMGMHRLITLK
jgi:hypothetical protein